MMSKKIIDEIVTTIKLWKNNNLISSVVVVNLKFYNDKEYWLSEVEVVAKTKNEIVERYSKRIAVNENFKIEQALIKALNKHHISDKEYIIYETQLNVL